MFKKEFIALYVSILTASLGIIFELFWQVEHAFQRSGSLVVCVGIWLVYSEIKRAYTERYERLVTQLESNRLENDIVWSDAELRAGVRGTTDHEIERALRDKDAAEKRVLRIEAIILISGTAIWGFGDLLF